MTQKTMLLGLLMYFANTVTTINQVTDNQAQVGLGASNNAQTDAITTNEIKDAENVKCQVEDACHLCSFKEL